MAVCHTCSAGFAWRAAAGLQLIGRTAHRADRFGCLWPAAQMYGDSVLIWLPGRACIQSLLADHRYRYLYGSVSDISQSDRASSTVAWYYVAAPWRSLHRNNCTGTRWTGTVLTGSIIVGAYRCRTSTYFTPRLYALLVRTRTYCICTSHFTH